MTAASPLANTAVLPDDQPTARHASLMEASAGITVRRPRRVPVDLILLVAACILFPLGVSLILLGWSGAAHTGKLYDQIDYLISGGLLGLALAGAGGFAYFGYWLSRQLDESRQQSADLLQVLRRVEQRLDGPVMTAQPAQTNGRANRPAAARGQAAQTRTAENPVVRAPVLLATARGTLLHRPGCSIVAGKSGVREVPVGTEGFGFCTICDAVEVVR